MPGCAPPRAGGLGELVQPFAQVLLKACQAGQIHPLAEVAAIGCLDQPLLPGDHLLEVLDHVANGVEHALVVVLADRDHNGKVTAGHGPQHASSVTWLAAQLFDEASSHQERCDDGQ